MIRLSIAAFASTTKCFGKSADRFAMMADYTDYGIPVQRLS